MFMVDLGAPCFLVVTLLGAVLSSHSANASATTARAVMLPVGIVGTLIGIIAVLASEGLLPVVEDNDAMRGSDAMVDPLGRLFGNATGRHVYSRPVVEVGVDLALA